MLGLADIPWPDEECIYFMDGSNFIHNGIRYAGAAVIDLNSVIWATALLLGTSAQKAELKSLTQALKKAKGAIANIYTDSR
jgi:ribonuclease HI